MTSLTPSEICTTPSPVADLTFGQMERCCLYTNAKLEDNYREALGFFMPGKTGERYNYLAYLFSDQNEMSFSTIRYSGFDRDITIDVREHGKGSLLNAVNDASHTMIDENSIRRTEGMELERNDQLNELALYAAIYFAAAGNDWLLGKSPALEIFCDRFDICVYGDVADFFQEDGKVKRGSEGVFPELTRVFRRLGYLGDSGIDLGSIVDAYGEEVFTFEVFSSKLSLPFTVNTLYSGKYSQPTINRQTSLARALGDRTMSVADMMKLVDENFYEKFAENYLEPALEAGMIEPVGEGDSRSQQYRCVVRN